MIRRLYLKRDGRKLWLYGERPTDLRPVVGEGAPEARPHLRWHPIREEWVIYAAHRGNGTSFRPRDTARCAPVVQSLRHRDPFSDL
jgi:UDPglucose--hexose-1-phosphate uridylyltransferase